VSATGPAGRAAWDVDLTGRVAVVTGGSRGLGREICRAFAACGATVVVASRKAAACEALAGELRAAGGDAVALPTHVGHWDACDALVDAVYDRYGRADVLVNNAGMSPRYDRLVDVTEALFDKVVDVNLKSVFRLSVGFGTRMAAGDGGSIINVSSISAVQPGPGELAYAAAKAGVDALTVGLARSFGPTVRTNAIMPGAFLTDISAAWDGEAFARTARERIVLGRGGDPREIVGAALYLAGDLSSYTTGAVIKVDGGYAYAPA
jgi:NAD(P)-dependent dehydrogenase (short-subunit alcohol dehydrogenase family)